MSFVQKIFLFCIKIGATSLSFRIPIRLLAAIGLDPHSDRSRHSHPPSTTDADRAIVVSPTTGPPVASTAHPPPVPDAPESAEAHDPPTGREEGRYVDPTSGILLVCPLPLPLACPCPMKLSAAGEKTRLLLKGMQYP